MQGTNMVIDYDVIVFYMEVLLAVEVVISVVHKHVPTNLHLWFFSFAIDPTFISSSFIRDEEKIYFFFSEVAREYDFIDKFIVSRVSQICMVRKKIMCLLEKQLCFFV